MSCPPQLPPQDNLRIESVIPPKMAKTLDKWITQLEKAMSEAKAKNTGEISEASSWFDDFTLAVQDTLPTWITAYRITKKDDIKNGSLSYRTVGSETS
jgi:hypothetical protein